MTVNDIINRILERCNIRSLALIDMGITKNAFGASKQTNTRLLSKSNSMMLILSLTNIAVSMTLHGHLEASLAPTILKSKIFLAMDKLHIYRENTKLFGGQSNRFMSRIGRICGGQSTVRKFKQQYYL